LTQEIGELKLQDEVEITQGQLKGLRGNIILIQNTNYVQIQLQSLQQNVKVKLPIHILKTVSPQ
jgi:transcription antitermination factor NusG